MLRELHAYPLAREIVARQFHIVAEKSWCSLHTYHVRWCFLIDVRRYDDVVTHEFSRGSRVFCSVIFLATLGEKEEEEEGEKEKGKGAT